MQHLPKQIKMHDKYKLLSPLSVLTLQQGAKGSLSDLSFSGIIQDGIPFMMNLVYIL
jgi:hypothetical protein